MLKLLLRIDPRAVYLLRFLLEGHDHMFLLTTLDRMHGIVEISLVRSAADDLCSILSEIEAQIGLDCYQWLETVSCDIS